MDYTGRLAGWPAPPRLGSRGPLVVCPWIFFFAQIGGGGVGGVTDLCDAMRCGRQHDAGQRRSGRYPWVADEPQCPRYGTHCNFLLPTTTAKATSDRNGLIARAIAATHCSIHLQQQQLTTAPNDHTGSTLVRIAWAHFPWEPPCAGCLRRSLRCDATRRWPFAASSITARPGAGLAPRGANRPPISCLSSLNVSADLTDERPYHPSSSRTLCPLPSSESGLYFCPFAFSRLCRFRMTTEKAGLSTPTKRHPAPPPPSN